MAGMPAVRLAQIRARADAATPGPWHRVGPPWNNDVPFVIAGHHDPRVGRFICDLDLIFSDEAAEDRDHVADGEFISHARQDVPDLLDEVLRLTEVERQRDVLEAALADARAEGDKLQTRIAAARKTAVELGPMLGSDPAKWYSARLVAELDGGETPC